MKLSFQRALPENFEMRRTSVLLSVVVCALAVMFACTKSSHPLAPSDGSSTGSTNADGSTLKVTAPAALSPINGTKPTTGLELKVTNSTTTFTTTGALSYRFQIYTTAGALVYESPLVPEGSGTTSFSANAN